MGIRETVAALCEPITLTQIQTLFRVVKQAARNFLVMVPQDKMDLFIAEMPVTATSNPDVIRLDSVVFNGRQCRQAERREIRLLTNTNSIYRSLSWDPVFYRDSGKVYVFGLATGDTAYAYGVFAPDFPAYSSDNQYDAIASVPGIPDEAQSLVFTLAASYWMIYRSGVTSNSLTALLAGSAADLAAFMTNFPTYVPPDEPTIVDVAPVPLDLSGIEFAKTALGSLATYTPITPPTLTALDLDGIDEPALEELPTLDLTGIDPPAPFTPAELDVSEIEAPSDPELPILDMDGLPVPSAPEIDDLDMDGITAPTLGTAPTLDLSGYVMPEIGTISKPTIGDVEYTAPDEPDPWPTVTPGSTPSWVNPGSPPDITPSLTAIGDLMTRFEDFIGKITSVATDPAISSTTANPSGAFWLKDEDEEMVNAAVQLAGAALQGARSYYDNTAALARIYEASVGGSSSKLQSEVAAYSAGIQAQVAVLQGEIQKFQAFIASARDAFEATAQAARLKLEEYQADASVEIRTFEAELQGWQTEIRTALEAWVAETRVYVDIFSAEVQAYNVAVRARIDPYQVSSQVKLQIYQTDAQVLQTIVSSRVEPYAVEARALVDKYSAQIQGYMAAIRAAVDPYQVSENVKLGIYQTEAQVYATLLRAKVDPYVAETQAIVSSYSAQVQAFSTLINSRIQPWATENQLALQRYQTVVEAGITEWRTRVETALRVFETENSIDLQAVRIEVERMTSEFQLNLQAKISNNQSELEAYRVAAEVRATEFQAGAAKARGYLDRVQVVTEQGQTVLAQVRSYLEQAMMLRQRFTEEFRMWATEGRALYAQEAQREGS